MDGYGARPLRWLSVLVISCTSTCSTWPHNKESNGWNENSEYFFKTCVVEASPCFLQAPRPKETWMCSLSQQVRFWLVLQEIVLFSLFRNSRYIKLMNCPHDFFSTGRCTYNLGFTAESRIVDPPPSEKRFAVESAPCSSEKKWKRYPEFQQNRDLPCLFQNLFAQTQVFPGENAFQMWLWKCWTSSLWDCN